MLLTLSNIVTLVMFEQLENALSPMLLTLLGIVTFPLHFVPSMSIPFTITSGLLFCWVSSHFVPENAAAPMFETLSGIVTFLRLSQSVNELSPMLLTLLGIITFVRLVHQRNAQSPMLVTLLGIVTLVRLVQPENT